MEQNIKLRIAYDGTRYHGFQVQPAFKTIQGELERCLKTIFKKHVTIFGAGRTDSGVHAAGQVVNFKHMGRITPDQLFKAMNSLLPDDIAVLSSENVDLNFHSRFDAKSRLYRYKILNRSCPDVFLRNYAYLYKYPLDEKLMDEACSLFVGTHDFTSFRATSKEEKSNIRTVFKFFCYKEDELIISEIEANGFLHNMVRILMGTVLLAGRGKKTISDIKRILDARNRNFAGPTLPSKGLTFVSVKY